MFGLFKKKSEAEKLQAQYEKLLQESFVLSKVDRQRSDEKMVEANQVLLLLEKIQRA